ncbi:MAG: tyrosyl-tRNA synthetase [Frankiaceae bacterium]|jgi:tyrosyl-tRNA synthetase|nr:tyrosyl-tRNA synthetase [Frankiaceae bacterium]MDX6226401.1 tyrosyl-tRNA synthetase [Frankiales bacterium]
MMRAVGILDELKARGLVALSTDEGALGECLSQPTAFYVGFDPTAPSLHIGHLVQVLTARRLQLGGHLPLALVGGATGLIGDPKASGERSLNDPDLVAGWVERIRTQVERFLEFEGPAAARMVNNLDWTADLSAIALLRDLGKHFSVNRMLDREAVATRLAAGGISYTEFSYVLLQSNDYLELFRRHDCRLQIGGSDQWGNITAGVELVRRVTGERVHALATPLLTKSDGTKFGKTEGGTVWLDPELTSPYAFFQFWLNAEDVAVDNLLRVFTFLPAEEVDRLVEATRERPAAREAQRALAAEVTRLVHGDDETQRVMDASAALFGRGELGALDEATLAAALTEAGCADVPELATVVDLLVASGLADSRGAARRTVLEGGAYVNNERIEDPDAVPTGLLHGRWLVLRRGKRNVAGIRVAP